MMDVRFALAIFLLAVGCPQPPAPIPHDYDAAASDTYLSEAGAGACQRAEDTLVRLGCKQARTPAGVPFHEACDHALDDGRNWRPDCLALITSCDQLDTVYRTPEGAPCK